MILPTFPASAAASEGESGGDPAYYVCFSDQNYAVRAANRMEACEEGYVLSDVTMNESRGFYVTDNSGMRYYGGDNDDLHVDEGGSYSYDILFSPDRIFDGEDGVIAKTDCHVSYRFHTPDSYSILIGETSAELTYNPYFTAYDLYLLSCVRLEQGQTVSFGEEVHEIGQTGYYRILFTPGEIREGNRYVFDKDGNYGSGDGYSYRVYIEDALRYFVVFEDTPDRTPDAQISGKPAFLLNRREQNIRGEEYRSEKFFLPRRDMALRYTIYEESLNGSYRPIDDDNDEDTDISKLIPGDAGWYSLSFTVSGDRFAADTVWEPVDFGGFYAVGDFNNYGFNRSGGVDISGKYRFTEIEEDDPDYADDYHEDYEQYILFLTVSQSDLTDGDLEFYISDGESKYKSGGEYIKLNTPGRYKILFSEEHSYGVGRHYRYTLMKEDTEAREIEIRTVEEFLQFAKDCNGSADYSVGLSVWLSADLDFEGIDFIPVDSFSGKFYGSTHELRNITIRSDADGCGVFGRVNRTGSVERLNVVNLTIEADECAYVGVVARNYGSIKKVNVSGSIAGKQTVGGVVGLNGQSEIDGDSATLDSGDTVQSGVILDCTNRARITGEVCVGGIAGINVGQLSGCENRGSVTPLAKRSGSNLQSIGGIAGYSAGQITDSVNSGSVGAKDAANYVGGICGLCTGEIYFSDNHGDVIGSRYAGGAVGYFGSLDRSSDTLTPGITLDELLRSYFPEDSDEPVLPEGTVYALAYLVSDGSVTAGSYAGGICGYSRVAGLTILHSISTGSVETLVGDYAGGIIGASEGAALVGCISAGSVKSHGSYAGGICGIGSDVTGCMSACDVQGVDYVGGIAGKITGQMRSNYANVLILGNADSKNIGSIAGAADAYNPSLNSFEGKIQYNYFVNGRGGIGGVGYGRNFDDAAASIESDSLAFAGMLSPELHEYFSHTYFVGGEDGLHYPAPYYLTVNADDLPECGEDVEVAALFEKHSARYGQLVSDITAVTYIFTLMEWNKDNGDLYDDDGVLQRDNFEATETVRVPAGGRVEQIHPVYAVFADGKYRYEGDTANYFVFFDLPETITENTAVYASYREIATTLSASDGAVLAEGEFVSGTVMELLPMGASYTLRFTLDGEEIEVGSITVKYRIGEDADRYEICTVSGETLTAVESAVTGDYLSFSWSDGDYFTARLKEIYNPPVWMVALISGGGVLVVGGAILLIVHAAKKRKKAK